LEEKERQKEKEGHRHLFITGIDQIISGTGHFWCDLCNEKKEMLPEKEILDDPAWANFVPQKVVWTTESPAYQDFDHGYRRRLITGSFSPALDQDWEKDCYATEGHKRGPLPHEGKDLPPNVSVATTKPAKWIPRISPAAIPPRLVPGSQAVGDVSMKEVIPGKKPTPSHACGVCSAKFYSLNQLRKHIRESAHVAATTTSTGAVAVPTTEGISLEKAQQQDTLLDLDNKTRALLLLGLCHQAGRITDDERAVLKAAFVRDEEIIAAAIQVFLMDRDIDELVDTFKRIATNLKHKD